jgi:C-terminal processing protease CtpA/Prc
MSLISHRLTLALSIIALLYSSAAAQQLATKFDRERGEMMLKTIKSDIKDKYYDPTFRGIDLDARFAAASEKMKTAASNGQIMGIIAQVLIEFQDSHTRFIPPSRANRTEYGWTAKIVGNRAFVTAIKPKSDAEAKGLKIGDEIVKIDDYPVSRESLWLLKYLYYTLRPQPGMNLSIKRPDGKIEQLPVMAKISVGKKFLDLTSGGDIWDLIRQSESEDYLNRHRFVSLNDVFIWKMPAFDLSDSDVDDMMSKAGKNKAIVLDLRGNGGGAVTTLNRLLGHFFDHDVKVGEWKGRKEFDPQIAKTYGGKTYTGKIITLIDSESASAAEIFARVMQIEKRGEVYGDRSSGKVMVSRFFSHKAGLDVVAFYGASVTQADLIMTDGKSLEYAGVAPDKMLLPSALAISRGIDPVLSFAVEQLGGKLDPEAAGKMFPLEWPK